MEIGSLTMALVSRGALLDHFGVRGDPVEVRSETVGDRGCSLVTVGVLVCAVPGGRDSRTRTSTGAAWKNVLLRRFFRSFRRRIFVI